MRLTSNSVPVSSRLIVFILYLNSSGITSNNSFKVEPHSYLTTVGLYNEHNELLAVAKLSKPFKKDPNTEALIKVRLDY